MTAIECAREQDLLDALASARWPAKCTVEMRDHVTGCAVCRDTLAVALPLLVDGEAAYEAARVPASSMVWWRAQMRARREAERVASRPITVVHAIAFVCGSVALAAMTLWASPMMPNWREWLHQLGGAVGTGTVAVTNAAASGLLPWVMLGTWVVLVPLGIYLALADD